MGEQAAFLASVPTLVGFDPDRSIVLVPFRQGRSLGCLRFDIPRGDPAAVLDVFVGTLGRFGRADEVRAVVYPRLAIASVPEWPHRDLAEAAVGRLTRRRTIRAGAWCVAPDGWGDYLDPRRERRSIDLLAAARLETRGVADGVSRSPVERAALPEVDPELARRTTTAIDRLLDRYPRADLPPEHRTAALTALRRAARGNEVAAGADTLAAFIVCSQRDDWLDDVVSEVLWEGTRPFRHEERVPSAARIRRAAVFVAGVAAVAPTTERAAVLKILATLHWSAGSASVAAVVVAQGLHLDPHDLGLHLLADAIHHGAVAPWWAADRDGGSGGR